MEAAQNITTSEIEAAILSLADIASACVVTGKTGDIEEIHILSSAARPPKQIVRDVESALMAKFGMELDHKKISVAQTQSNRNYRFTGTRLKFSEVSISLNGAKGEATVRLKKNEDVFSGTAAGNCSSQNQLRLIASATLYAVEESLGSETNLLLEDLGTILLAGRNVVVVCVNMITQRTDDYLTGSAIVKQDIGQAVVNAALDAVNRRLGAVDV